MCDVISKIFIFFCGEVTTRTDVLATRVPHRRGRSVDAAVNRDACWGVGLVARGCGVASTKIFLLL